MTTIDQRLPLDILDGPPPGPERTALLLALLLASPEPATSVQLAMAAGLSEDDVVASLRAVAPQPADGWVIQEHHGTWQLATASRFAPQVRRLLKLDRESRLSAAALETLAIVAYQQPVTRAEIETVRGVDSSGVLATLHSRALIEAVGRLSTPGNPIQYGTTSDFLKHFGLTSLADLPPLGQVDGRDIRDSLSAAALTTEFASVGSAEREATDVRD